MIKTKKRIVGGMILFVGLIGMAISAIIVVTNILPQIIGLLPDWILKIASFACSFPLTPQGLILIIMANVFSVIAGLGFYMINNHKQK